MLGAMLLSADAINVAAGICTAEDFYKPRHGNLFRAMTHLSDRGEAVDVITVTDEMKRTLAADLVADPAELVELQSTTPSVANVQHYATIVKELSTLRRLAAVAGEISDLAYSAPSDVEQAVDEAEIKLMEISDSRNVDSMALLNDLLDPSLDRIDELARNGGQVTGIRTGFIDLDRVLSGLQPSTLSIIGARPAMGKTAFALGILVHVGVVERKPALLFSLEMSHLELTQRLLASESSVDAQKMKLGQLSESDWDKVNNQVTRLSASRSSTASLASS